MDIGKPTRDENLFLLTDDHGHYLNHWCWPGIRFAIWTEIEQAFIASEEIHETAIVLVSHPEHRCHVFVGAFCRLQSVIYEGHNSFPGDISTLVAIVNAGP